METVPKLQNISQNYVKIQKGIRHRRGDNAPIVHVMIKNSEKEEVARLQDKQAKQKRKEVDIKVFHRKVLAQEKAKYERLMSELPDQAEFFKRKIAKVEFDEWTLDKAKG